MTEEEKKALADSMSQMLKDSKGEITEEVKSALVEMAKGNEAKLKELEEIAIKQGNSIKELKEKGMTPAQKINLKQAVRNELTSKFAGKTIDEIKSMVHGGLKIEIKAASTFLEATHTTGQVQTFEVDPMWDAAPRKRLFLRDVVGSVSTSNETTIVREKYNEDGDAAWVAEGSIKSLVDFDLRTQTYHAKEISASTEVGENSLADITGLMAEIENEIIYQIEEKEQYGELFGTGGSNDPVGLTVIASAFVLTSMKEVEDPNRIDALIAANTQLKSLNFTGDFVALNPIDADLMKLAKDESGAYLLPTDRQALAGYSVIESNDIPVGYFLLGDSTKTNIKDYQSLQIAVGYSGTGFENGIVTIRGTKRILAYTKTQNQPAFIYDSFENVMAAIMIVNN